MKKLFLIFTLFIILICISSFSWASTLTNLTSITPTNNNLSPYLQILYDDYSSYINQNNIDLSNYYLLSYSYDNYLELYFSSEPLVVRNNGNHFYSRGKCYFAEFEQDNNAVYVSTFSYNNSSINLDYGAVNILDASNIYVNQDYTINNVNSSFVVQDVFEEYLYNDYPCNYVIIDSNDDVVIEKEENGEGGEEGGEDDNGGILNFLTNFWSNLGTNLLHIVVPSNEDWSDLQDSFEDNILEKFNITSMSFNDDLQYDWRSYNTS